MSSSPFELALTDAATGGPIRNLYPAYLHDISEYDGRAPNVHGVMNDSDEVRTWEEVMETQRAWWTTPDLLFPYLARVGGVPGGFNLVASGPYVPVDDVDFIVYEFFVAHAFRGDGTASRLAQESIAKHRGAWEVVTYPSAARPIAFWRKTLPLCATGEVVESEGDHPFGRKVIWRFRNDGPAT